MDNYICEVALSVVMLEKANEYGSERGLLKLQLKASFSDGQIWKEFVDVKVKQIFILLLFSLDVSGDVAIAAIPRCHQGGCSASCWACAAGCVLFFNGNGVGVKEKSFQVIEGFLDSEALDSVDVVAALAAMQKAIGTVVANMAVIKPAHVRS